MVYLPMTLKNYTNIPLGNGNFEDSDSELTPWQKVEAAVPVNLSPGDPAINGGEHNVLIGDPSVSGRGDAPVGNGRIWQTFSIPNVSDVAEITIYYRIVTQDIVRSSHTNDYLDSFEIYLDNNFPNSANEPSTDDPIREIRCAQELGRPLVPAKSYQGKLIFCDGRVDYDQPEDLGWRSVILDLSAYKGEVVTLHLASFSRWDGWDNTYTYIDNIQASWQQ